MTTDHATHAVWFIGTCSDCAAEYYASRPDPLRAPLTDEEPWSLTPEPPQPRDWTRLAVLLTVGVLAVTYLAVTR